MVDENRLFFERMCKNLESKPDYNFDKYRLLEVHFRYFALIIAKFFISREVKPEEIFINSGALEYNKNGIVITINANRYDCFSIKELTLDGEVFTTEEKSLCYSLEEVELVKEGLGSVVNPLCIEHNVLESILESHEKAWEVFLENTKNNSRK